MEHPPGRHFRGGEFPAGKILRLPILHGRSAGRILPETRRHHAAGAFHDPHASLLSPDHFLRQQRPGNEKVRPTSPAGPGLRLRGQPCLRTVVRPLRQNQTGTFRSSAGRDQNTALPGAQSAVHHPSRVPGTLVPRRDQPAPASTMPDATSSAAAPDAGPSTRPGPLCTVTITAKDTRSRNTCPP